MTDQNFKRVSDDSRVCAVLTENDPCVRYCVLCGNAFIDENVLSNYTILILCFLSFGIILNI